MTASEVIGGILLARDELLGVEELPVSTGADLVNHSGLKIEVDSTWNVLASTSLAEESVERLISISGDLITSHKLAIRLLP